MHKAPYCMSDGNRSKSDGKGIGPVKTSVLSGCSSPDASRSQLCRHRHRFCHGVSSKVQTCVEVKTCAGVDPIMTSALLSEQLEGS